MKLLHFTAEWCGPCKMMKPVVDSVVGEYELEYISIDIDSNPETTADYNVLGVPTFILVNDSDEITAQIVGALPRDRFLDALGI